MKKTIMNTIKKINFGRVLPVVLLLALAITAACSSVTETGHYDTVEYYEEEWEDDYDLDSYDGDAMEEDGRLVAIESTGLSDSVPVFGSGKTATNDDSVPEQMITQSGSVYIEATEEEYDAIKENIHALIDMSNGYISSSTERQIEPRDGASYRTYTITMEIPSDQLEEVYGSITGIGEVTKTSLKAKDMSQSYQNYEEKIASEKLLKERMERLLDQAVDFDDILEIEEKLFEIDRNIASYEKAMSNIDFDVGYSDLYVQVVEKKEGVDDTFANFLSSHELLENVVNSFEHLLEILSHLFAYILIVALAIYVWVRKKGKSKKK
jgi:hypothetical protein